MKKMQRFGALHLVVLLRMSLLLQEAAASTKLHKFMRPLGAKAFVNVADPPKPNSTSTWQADEVMKESVNVKWTKHGNIPHIVASIVGVVWVAVLGSTPIFIYKLDNRKVTTTGLSLAGLLWLALFGGLFLFTNIILFNSPHFDEVRSLSIIECCYFMTQVITTVGYGDITPAKPRGQLFVGLYVVLAFFVIALLVSEMQSAVVSRVEKYKGVLEKHTGVSLKHQSGKHNILAFKAEKPSYTNALLVLGLFVLICAAWITFFHCWPGENKTLSQATYMCLITLTTVGFGAITPVTEGGMMFSAFFMFLGTAALVALVTEFGSFMLEMAEWEAWDPHKFHNDLEQLRDHMGPGHEISEADFLTFVLIQKGIVNSEQIAAVKGAYQSMRSPKTGSVTTEKVEEYAGIAGAN